MPKIFKKLAVTALVAVSATAFAEEYEADVDARTFTGPDAVVPAVPNTANIGGTLQIKGKVVSNTCYISSDEQNKIVTLDAIESNKLKNASNTGNQKAFTIRLDGCPVVGYYQADTAKYNNVSIYFDSTSPTVDTSTGNLKPASKGDNVASNVQIQLLNEAGTAINLASDKAKQAALIKKPFTVGDETVVFNFSAQYYATGAATPGVIDTSIPFAIDYP